jgi:hypothetical protein
MSDEPKIGKRAMKRMTKELIMKRFTDTGCGLVERSAGAVNYIGVQVGEGQNCAAIYGSKNRACSVWVKEDAFEMLKEKLSAETHVVEDVSMFRRGFQWSIHVNDVNDPIIDALVDVCIETGSARFEKTHARRELEARRASERGARKARMDAKRRDPFA